jgi:hypothetical protein
VNLFIKVKILDILIVVRIIKSSGNPIPAPPS